MDQYQAAGYAYADTPSTPPTTGNNEPPPPPPDKAYGDKGTKKEEGKKEEAKKEEEKPAEEEAKPEEPKPWTLPQPCFLQCHNIKLDGWIEQGANFNFHGTEWNGVVPFDDFSGYQLNQLWFFLDRPTDTSKCDWDWGGHVDVCFGTDPRFFKDVVGLEASWDETGRYQLALPQFYFDLAHDDWVFRFGHFVTLLSYEVIQSPQNFFYSHSYQFSYAVPFTHTGALAIKKFGEDKEWSITARHYRGQRRLQRRHGELPRRHRLYAEGRQVLAGLQPHHGRQHVRRPRRAADHLQPGRHEEAQRLSRRGRPAQVRDRARPGLAVRTRLGRVVRHRQLPPLRHRQEVDGRHEGRVVPRQQRPPRLRPLCPQPGLRGLNGGSFAGNFYEFTWGLNYKSNLNTTIRPEIRYDWYQGPASPTGVLPFGNGTHSDQGMMACDAIFTY